MTTSAAISGTAHVADGDTLRVGATRVRLSGVDAPELLQRCGSDGRMVACGTMAAEWLRRRVEGRPITCEQVDTDRYGRSVAICRVGGEDIGAAIVEAGWATAYRSYSMAYVGQEARARAARRGIWALGFEAPSDYRRERRLADVPVVPDPRCPIKGNVGSSGERIYHMPGSRAYPEVRIDARKGERLFCSEREAVAAGWRPIR
ncbi:thermonuclease family protein [Sphingobium sp. AntQ-1]|uniref:thermonuclease family protein n=1 Tax=Sphingobium sp. AntQ-1 TaxID=2930091 RepID=UPI00234ECAEE|nr:thermonuclease family protein [Sphingobium sp. AntQ-1]